MHYHFHLRFDAPHHIRDKYMERYFDYQNYSKYKVPSLDAFDRNNVDDVLNFIRLTFLFSKTHKFFIYQYQYFYAYHIMLHAFHTEK